MCLVFSLSWLLYGSSASRQLLSCSCPLASAIAPDSEFPPVALSTPLHLSFFTETYSLTHNKYQCSSELHIQHCPPASQPPLSPGPAFSLLHSFNTYTLFVNQAPPFSTTDLESQLSAVYFHLNVLQLIQSQHVQKSVYPLPILPPLPLPPTNTHHPKYFLLSIDQQDLDLIRIMLDSSLSPAMKNSW